MIKPLLEIYMVFWKKARGVNIQILTKNAIPANSKINWKEYVLIINDISIKSEKIKTIIIKIKKPNSI